MTTLKAGASAKAKAAKGISKVSSVFPADAEEFQDVAFETLPRTAALNLDKLWIASQGRYGQVDVVDMFSGCGGMSVGFQAVNGIVPAFRIAGAVDVDKVANESYKINFGIAPQLKSVADIAKRPNLTKQFEESLRPSTDRPLVLIGCAPCQGFSSHRNEQGESDPRNSLFLDFARIAARLQPEAIVIENVPELFTDRYWPLVEKATEILTRAGYYVHRSVHNMAEFGVPQERFRALILAMKHRFEPPKGFLKRHEFRTVRDAIGSLPKIGAGARTAKDPMHFTAGHKDSTIATIMAVPKDGGSRPDDVGPECLRRAKERSGRAAYEDVYGRLFWDRPAITITAHARNPASGRYVHPDQHRGLSIREAALLQSFPKNYVFSGSLDERFRQIGNAVPPAFAAFLASTVFREITCKKEVPKFDSGMSKPVGPSFSRLIASLKAGHRSEINL